MSEKQLKHIPRALSFLFGFLCIIVAMLCSLLDNEVLRASFTVMGVNGGPLLGIFILGMFFPVANSLSWVPSFAGEAPRYHNAVLRYLPCIGLLCSPFWALEDI
uniref:Uncharacterized protein n=1 Tax=Eptatretus burgeri TaxID=7764 RepID=A0A8C4QX11_EPTBU